MHAFLSVPRQGLHLWDHIWPLAANHCGPYGGALFIGTGLVALITCCKLTRGTKLRSGQACTNLGMGPSPSPSMPCLPRRFPGWGSG